MFKFLFWILFLTALVLGAILLVQEDPGFVLVKYGDYSIETTLAFGIIAVAVATVLIHYLFKVLMGVWHIPRAVKNQSKGRRFSKSRKLLNQGLIDLAEGHYDKAEANLVKMVDYSESPLLHYLAAARAAQLQGRYQERDKYLKAAHEARPEAEFAIGVTQAELQLAHQQTEESLATLTHLRGIAPRHDHVLRLLARVYLELEDWSSLIEILPDVQKKKLLSEHLLKTMETKTYQGFLATARNDQQTLEKAWNKIPKTAHTDADLVVYYINLSNQAASSSSNTEQLIVGSLGQKWDNRLIEAYGLFRASDPNEQLKQAEKWLDDYAKNEYLLLALGRICIRAKLWGKAQSYLEASIGVRAMPANCLALAELLSDHLQQKDKASEYYQKGLRLSLSEPASATSI
ncbi:MAG: heme biosynthesis HemY N-terminal domain-containing protein [Gammaproteobacteria bacterium]